MVALRGGGAGGQGASGYCPGGSQGGHVPQPRLGPPQQPPQPQPQPPHHPSQQPHKHHPHNLNSALPSHHFTFLSQTHPLRYPRAGTPQQRSDCYHGMGGGGYMGGGGGPAPGPHMQQAVMRAPDLRAPSAQSPTQQPINVTDLKQPPMTHNFVPQQPAQPRPQLYAAASYRPAATPRPTHRAPTHHQQLYQGNAATGAPMMYPIMYPQHSVIPQQYGAPQRPACFPTHVTSLMNHTYCITPSPFQQTQPPQQAYYYQTAGQPMLPTSLASPATGRNNNSMVATPPAQQPPPGAPSPIQHQLPPQGHIHMPAQRPMNVPPVQAPQIRKKRSFAIAITHPVTGEDVSADLYSDHTQTLSGESSERQTPQPEHNSVAEDFNRQVNEKLNIKMENKYPVNRKYDQPAATGHNLTQSVPNQNASTVNVPNLNVTSLNPTSLSATQPVVYPSSNKIEVIPTEKVIETVETPIVSAISGNPVIVPKLPSSKPAKAVDAPSPKKETKPEMEEELQENSMQKHMSAPSFVPGESIQIAQVVQEATVEIAPVSEGPNVANAMAPLPQRVKKETKKQETPAQKEHSEPNLTVNGPVTHIEIAPEPLHLIEPKEEPVQEKVETSEVKVETEAELPTKQAEVAETPTAAIVPPSESVETVSDNTHEVGHELTTQDKLYQNLKAFNKNQEIPDPIEADTNPVIIETVTEIEKVEEEINDYNKNQLTSDINKNDTSEIIEDINKNNEKTASKLSDNIVRDNESGQNKTDSPATETEVEIDTPNEKTSIDDETDSKTDIVTPPIVKPAAPEKPVLKYHYRKNQWSPINPSGKKVYDRDFLLQLQDDPLSLIKPENINMLPAVMKPKSPDGLLPLANLTRHAGEAFMPLFAKSPNAVKGPSRERDRDPKKSSLLGVKSASMKSPTMNSSMLGQAMSSKQNVFHVSIQLRGDVKLNETENAWKPTRKVKNTKLSCQDEKTQDIYRQFRGILNKITPENFSTLLEKVKSLDISTQERLVGVIDLIFEKAIDEPNFSVTYANMCSKLSKHTVPDSNNPERSVSFQSLILNKCQSRFETNKCQEKALKIEKQIAECEDQAKKKELVLQLDEENRKIRMRSVGNVRFIGELYKLSMLSSDVMLNCLWTLIEKLEEEKLECLCKLLTTIGELLEQKSKTELDKVFANMQNIVEKKSSKVSSRIRFMIQDVMALRRRRWTTKNVIDAQPKTIDQIQKEADYQQRQIELMNSGPMSRDYRGRDEGGRKRGDGRRSGSNNMDNWQHSQRTKYTVDTSKLKAASTISNKNLSNIKLGPPGHAWNHGSGAKPVPTVQPVASPLTNNMYSALENVTIDSSILRSSKDNYHHSKGVSLERSAFNSRSDHNSNNSKSSSSQAALSNSSSRSSSEHMDAPLMPRAPSPVAELSDAELRLLHSILQLHLMNPNDEEFVHQLKDKFQSATHSKVVYELYCYALDKNSKSHRDIANTINYAVEHNAISRTSFIIGFSELLELAPDLLIDYPKIYEYLATFITPLLMNKHMSMHTLMETSEKIIAEGQGHFFLKSVLEETLSLHGEEKARQHWSSSGCRLTDWMPLEQASKLCEHAQLSKIVGSEPESSARSPGPDEVHSTLLKMMNLDKSCECIRTYIKEFVDTSTKEDWFMRVLMQSVCEHALFGRAGEGAKKTPRLNMDRMSKYVHLVNEYGNRDTRDISCLNGIAQLLHRLEHPKGVTLEIFQHLSDHYIIQREGFLAFEKSDQELVGKGVMMKALVSFYTSIMEVDNEDSCSED